MNTVLLAGAIALLSACGASGAPPPSHPAAAAPVAQPFGIIYRAGPAWRPGVPMRGQGLREHYFYWKRLHQEGRVIAAGEFGPDGGLVLLDARGKAEADGVIAADPAVAAGLFVGEARLFLPRFVATKSLSAVKP